MMIYDICIYIYIYCICVCVHIYSTYNVYLIFADVQVFYLFWGFYMFFSRWILLLSVVSKEPALIMSFGEPFLHISSLAEACTNNAGPAFTNAWRAIKQRPWWNMAVGKVVGWKNHGTYGKPLAVSVYFCLIIICVWRDSTRYSQETK